MLTVLLSDLSVHFSFFFFSFLLSSPYLRIQPLESCCFWSLSFFLVFIFIFSESDVQTIEYYSSLCFPTSGFPDDVAICLLYFLNMQTPLHFQNLLQWMSLCFLLHLYPLVWILMCGWGVWLCQHLLLLHLTVSVIMWVASIFCNWSRWTWHTF